MSALAHAADTCRCGHPWHEDRCTARRTVADTGGGTKRADCRCEQGRALTDPAGIGPSPLYVEAFARRHLGLVPPPRALPPAPPEEDPTPSMSSLRPPVPRSGRTGARRPEGGR